MGHLQQVQDFIAPWLQQQSAVEAAILFGSALTNWPDTDGDMDLLLICTTPNQRKQQVMRCGVRLDLTFVDNMQLAQLLRDPGPKRKWLEILARAELLWSRTDVQQAALRQVLTAARQEWLSPFLAPPAMVALAEKTVWRCLRKMAQASQQDWSYRHFSQLLLEHLYLLLCYQTQQWPFDYVVDQQRHLAAQFEPFALQWQQCWCLPELAMQREALKALALQVIEKSDRVPGAGVTGVSDAKLA